MSAEVVRVEAIRVEDRAQTHSVYGAIDAAGDTLYVGCTNDIARAERRVNVGILKSVRRD